MFECHQSDGCVEPVAASPSEDHGQHTSITVHGDLRGAELVQLFGWNCAFAVGLFLFGPLVCFKQGIWHVQRQ
jgi:hypothetical protein